MRSLGSFSTDFTELTYDGGRKKAWMMVLVDIESKWAGGWSVGPSRNRHMAIEAVESLREGMASVGRCGLSGVIVHHDRDSVYTSHAWLERLLVEERTRGFPMPREGRRTIPGSSPSGAGLRPRTAS